MNSIFDIGMPPPYEEEMTTTQKDILIFVAIIVVYLLGARFTASYAEQHLCKATRENGMAELATILWPIAVPLIWITEPIKCRG